MQMELIVLQEEPKAQHPFALLGENTWLVMQTAHLLETSHLRQLSVEGHEKQEELDILHV